METIGLPFVEDERMLRAVETVYATALDPSRWPDALQAIADAFDDVGCLLNWVRDDRSFGYVASPSLDAAHQDYLQNWSHRDLRAMRALELGFGAGGETLTDRDVVSPEEIETHPYYTEFLARHGLKWFLGTGISPDPRIHVALSLQRAGLKPPYADAEAHRLIRIGRHAEQALRLSIRLLDAELGNTGLREALSRLGIGVFALDTLGRVVFSNPAGARILGDGIFLEDGQLRIGKSASKKEAETAIARTLRGELKALAIDPKPLLIQRSKSRPLAMYVLPVGSTKTPAQEFLTHARAIVLIIDPQAHEPPDPTVVRDVFGLTLSEARVAALIGSGLPPREAAGKLGIAEETARTALKRVFSKVGVSRQSELAALLAKLVMH